MRILFLLLLVPFTISAQDIDLRITWEVFDQIQREIPVEDKNDWNMFEVFRQNLETRAFFMNTSREYPEIEDDTGVRIATGFIRTVTRTVGGLIRGDQGFFIGYSHQHVEDPELPFWADLIHKSSGQIRDELTFDRYMVSLLNRNMTERAREKFGRVQGIRWSAYRQYIIGLNFQRFDLTKDRGSRNFEDDIYQTLIRSYRPE